MGSVRLGDVIVLICFVAFLSNLISPFMLSRDRPDMMVVFGNPKPIYFYDIEPSCSDYEIKIVSALKVLSNETGVKFIRLPPPVALVIGGIEYDCGKMMTITPTANGEYKMGEYESETHSYGILFFSWNKISLSYNSTETILHETLHSMGFGHNQNPESIMYSYARGYDTVDADIVTFIKKIYVGNPLAYFNIISLNILSGLLILYVIYPKNRGY